MRSYALVTGLLLSVAVSAQPASTNYPFRAFVEHYPGGGGIKPFGYGTIVGVNIKVNNSAPATATGDTATYGGDCNGPSPPPSPILSITVAGKALAAGCDTITITKKASGPAAIVIQRMSPQIGAATFSFDSASGSAVGSLKLPDAITTLNFDTARFSISYPAAYIAGDMATR